MVVVVVSVKRKRSGSGSVEGDKGIFGIFKN